MTGLISFDYKTKTNLYLVLEIWQLHPTLTISVRMALYILVIEEQNER